MTMPDGNSAAESRRNADEAADESLRGQFYEKALEDLVERMMNDEEYPRRVANGRDQINRLDILHECDHAVLADAVNTQLQEGAFSDALETAVERLVRDYLRDSSFHERRIAEMIEEARDEQE